jgi:septal ring factor EnvC (AmiA/AmiB activator)
MLNFIAHSNNSRSAGFRSLVAATTLAILISVGICETRATAQDAPSQDSQAPSAPPAEGGRHWGHHHRPSVDQQMKHLTKALKLSDDQQTKVRSALEDQNKQMEQIRNDSSLSRDDRFSKMKQIHDSTNTQIKSVLNADQQNKFDEIQQKHQEHMRGHQGTQQ